ncbi:MAG: glycosyltransferase [Balneolaceae bacterium]|nr:glycosyltransferase [Balneolaceae bacterium]
MVESYMVSSQYKDKSPLVSVIIPTYNGEKFLKETIESVLNQTFDDYELIICDDLSNDLTVEIIDQYLDEPKVSFFQNDRRLGIGGNWNNGIKKSSGKYVKILCQDDILLENYLRDATDVLEQDDHISLVTTFEGFFGKYDRVLHYENLPLIHRENKPPGKMNRQKARESVLKYGNWIGGPTCTIFRKSDLGKVGLFSESIYCSLDWEQWLRLLAVGDLYVLPKMLLKTRLHNLQETNNCLRNLGFKKDRVKILKLIKNHPEIYGNFKTGDLNQWIDHSILKLMDGASNNERVNFGEIISFLNKQVGFYRTAKLRFKFALIKIHQKLCS